MTRRGARRRLVLFPRLLAGGLLLAACGAPAPAAPVAGALPPAAAGAVVPSRGGPDAATVQAVAVSSSAVLVDRAALPAPPGGAGSSLVTFTTTENRPVVVTATASDVAVTTVQVSTADAAHAGVAGSSASTSLDPGAVSPQAAPVAAPAGAAPAGPAVPAIPAAAAPAMAPVHPATPAVASAATPATATLGPLINIVQTLNNCGPASVAEVLRYWGISRTQGQVQTVLRADGNPRGMEPYGVPAYAASLGLDALMGTGGSDALVKALVSNGFPVIVSQWVSASNHIGHYRPIEGYDDQSGVFVASDPLLGPGHQIDYGEFDRIWATNNNRFMVLYPPAKQALLQTVLLSTGWDKSAAYQADLAKLQRRVAPRRDVASAFSRSWQGYGAVSLAWDQLQLGDLSAARASLAEAAAQHANPVLVQWISAALQSAQGAPAGAAS